MRACILLDRYRDGELDASSREQFESHLKDCSECRSKIFLLNNLVCALRQVQPALSPTLPERVSRIAFGRTSSWDALVISWLRPAPTWAALILAILISAYTWLIPTPGRQDVYGEYEALVNESFSSSPGVSGPTRNDDDLIRWLEQEGNVR